MSFEVFFLQNFLFFSQFSCFQFQASTAFLISQQQESGAFAERGEVHHKQMQGGAAEGGFPLTAYVLVALLENHVQNRFPGET